MQQSYQLNRISTADLQVLIKKIRDLSSNTAKKIVISIKSFDLDQAKQQEFQPRIKSSDKEKKQMSEHHKESAKDLIQVLEQLYKNQQFQSIFQKSFKYLEKPRFQTNDLAKIYLIIANSYQTLRKYQQAIDNYKQGLKMNSSQHSVNGFLHNNLAIVASKIGHMQLAISHFRQCLQIYQEKPFNLDIGKTYQTIGLLYLRVQMFDTARVQFAKSLQIRQKNGQLKQKVRSMTLLGECFMKMNKFQESIFYFKRISKLLYKQSERQRNSVLIHAKFKIAECFEKLGRWETAIDQYNNLLEISDNKKLIFMKIGEAYIRMQQQQSGLKYMKLLLGQLQKRGELNQVQSIRSRIRMFEK